MLLRYAAPLRVPIDGEVWSEPFGLPHHILHTTYVHTVQSSDQFISPFQGGSTHLWRIRVHLEVHPQGLRERLLELSVERMLRSQCDEQCPVTAWTLWASSGCGHSRVDARCPCTSVRHCSVLRVHFSSSVLLETYLHSRFIRLVGGPVVGLCRNVRINSKEHQSSKQQRSR